MQNSLPITIASIYRFLAQSMRYPDAHWFDNQYWSALLHVISELQWFDDVAALEKWQSQTADCLEDVQVEYTRLFINAVPHVVAPPYASSHTDGDGSLYGNFAEKTKQFYRDNGFTLKDTSDMPDHIVFELDFLGLLSDKDEQAENIFLRTLFIPWFSIFMSRVLEESEHPFYRVVLRLIDFFTREGN